MDSGCSSWRRFSEARLAMTALVRRPSGSRGETGLQVARPLSRARAGGAGRPVARAASSGQCAWRPSWPRRSWPCGRSDRIGGRRSSRRCWRGGAGAGLAGREHDRRSAQAARPDPAAVAVAAERCWSGRRRIATARRQPNERWCIDFKGWFRTRDGLSLRSADPDRRRQRAISCWSRSSSRPASAVDAAVERLLREQGLPERLLMDNGSPFASSGVAGLSGSSVKWLKLGIGLERITPGCPQENGRHERMHRTLKAETSRPPAASPAGAAGALRRASATTVQPRPPARGVGAGAAGEPAGNRRHGPIRAGSRNLVRRRARGRRPLPPLTRAW